MPPILLTYFSIGSLIASLMIFLGGLLLLSLPKKSTATLHLGLMLLFLALFSSGYVFASSFFDNRAALHRWITVAFVFPAIVHMLQFFFHYPALTHPRAAKAFLVIWYAITIGTAVYFFAGTISAPRVYHYDGHYWDFDADAISANVARLIQLGVLCFFVIGSWRTIVTPGRERWVVLGMMLALLTLSVVPSALNTRSREGAMDRGTFILLWDLLSVLGIFSMIVLYINNTKDRTSFMVKIVGISLVVALLILQGLSYFLIKEREYVYDAVHVETSRRIILDNTRPADLQYITTFSPAENRISALYTNGIAAPTSIDHRTEILNTALRYRIESLPENGFNAALEKLLANCHEAFNGYAAVLRAYNAEPAPAVNRGAALFARVDGLFYTILFRYNKIRALPAESFRQDVVKFLSKDTDAAFRPFRAAMEAHLSKSTAEGGALKEELLQFLSLAKPPGFRHYRDQNRDPTIAYILVESDGTIHETGYSYLNYRQFIHGSGLTLGIMLAAVLVVILGGFRIFFLGALVSPLNALQEGMRTVNEGDLDVRLPIRVEDEIGFMTKSFNGMVRSIKAARKKLQDYAGNLETKVQERTQELQVTLDEIRALKQQQDGDYFLTSLLIKPLATNQVTSGTVAVEFLVRQKKRFDFKKWKDEELGGDICMADTLVLKGKDHTVFLNGDAMGKSIQGAGGALVLGSVFEAIVARTKLTDSMKDQYPERWLKTAFIELQKVFESFDGYMLVSMVLGLIDNESGLLYYLNAEHPWTVVYRQGKAQFIEKELRYRKLGMPGLEGSISIETFQLTAGDILIAGSDGRDDLVIGTDASGERIINEDEHRFLGTVEAGRGNLQSIYQELMNQGEIMDDLSLMRLGFREEHPAAEQGHPSESAAGHLKQARAALLRKEWSVGVAELERANDLDSRHPRIMRSLAIAYQKAGQLAKAAAMAEDYTFIRPDQLEFVYLASYCYRKSGHLERAVELGERVRLRSPALVKNLINLADAYYRLGNRAKAESLLAQAMRHSPDHPAAQNLARILAEPKEGHEDPA